MAKYSDRKLPTNQRKKWHQTLQKADEKKNLGESNKKVLIDTNVWFSAIAFGGTPESVVKYCLEHCRVITGQYLLDELAVVLRDKLSAPNKWKNRILALIKQKTLSPDVPLVQYEVRDPKDSPIVATAIHARCGCIITGDLDLLELGVVESVTIVTPTEFIRSIKE
ncbi:putative toxin-antitoxin system toxin component, PIN family [soil metagenome]